MEKQKRNWKQEIKEDLQLVGFAAICGLVVFQANHGCTRQENTDAAMDASAKKDSITIQVDSLRHNQIVRSR